MNKGIMIIQFFILSFLFHTVAICQAAYLDIDGWKVEYYRNHPTGDPSTDYDQAVIVIHGTNRNADEYYNYVFSAANTENVTDHTLIIAPRFKTEDDFSEDVFLQDIDELYWDNSGQNGWKEGMNSKNGSMISSFQVIDHILEKININFPNIKLVSIVGHSAGGQFVQRYAAINEKECLLRANIEMRYIVANPSSYMYLTDERPVDIEECIEYNNYKYGMANLPDALPYTNLSHEAIQNQLMSRSIYLLLGTNDTDPNSSSLDRTCPANMQGENRYQRGHNYYDHIKRINKNANHHVIDIADIGHNAEQMFNSSQGRRIIFHSKMNFSAVFSAIKLLLKH